MGEDTRQVYISYAWGGESERIVNELDADLQTRGIVVVRDKRDLGYKGSILGFMQEIGRGRAVIVVISDKYLKSPNCMVELVEIARNQNVRDRIFPVVLADADIYDPVNRVRYIKHWEDKLKQLDEAMRSVSAANLQGMREEIDSYDAIRDHVSGLTFLLKDMNTLTPEMHENSNFASLIAGLERRLKEVAAMPPAAPVAAPPAPAAAPVAAPAAAPAAPVSPVGDTSAYLAGVAQRITADGYQPVQGERSGPLRFKAAYEKIEKGWLGSDHRHVVAFEEAGLTPERITALNERIRTYTWALNEKTQENHFVIGLVLTGALSEDTKTALYDLPPPKLSLTDGRIWTLAAWSTTENDIFYPSEFNGELGTNFEAAIKKYLTP